MATVTEPPTGESTVELRLEVGARLHLESSAALPAGTYELALATGDQEFRVVHQTELRGDTPFTHDATWPVGAFRWRLRGRVTAMGEAPRLLKFEGNAVATAATPSSTATTVTLPVDR